MTQPSYEELEKRLADVEKLVQPYYEPPSGNEMSFPVERQGITQTQFQQMNLPTGDGVIITDDSENSHILTGHSSDSETNARNTLILRVAANTGRAEAVIAGFYHVLHEDVELEFPPVSSTTTYYVCITYDPRRFRDQSGPVFLKVYDDTPPETDGRKHLILHTVTRRPNELLTRAERRLYRQAVSPVITVSRGEEGLPEATQVPYSTIGILRSRTSGGSVVPGTGQIYEARGIHGWHKLLGEEWEDAAEKVRDDLTPGPWRQLRLSTGNNWGGSAYYRERPGGVDVVGNVSNQSSSVGNAQHVMAQFPTSSGISLRMVAYFPVMSTSYDGDTIMRAGHSGGGRDISILRPRTRPSWIRFNFFIPDYYLN